MTKEEFRQLCKAAWEKQHWFAIIDLNSKKHNDKYTSEFDEFYILKTKTSFTYLKQLKTKTNIIFSLQNGESS